MKIRNTIKSILTLIGVSILLTACSDYEKVLKSKDMNYKLTKAKEYYERGKYLQANTLLQENLQFNRTSKNYEEIYYLYAQSFYKMRKYWDAALYFNSFATSFPNSNHLEEARYLAAKSYEMNSPRYVLDQRDTKRAIDAYRSFKLNFPSSERITSVDSSLSTLERKLEKKAYEAAKLYLKIEQYKAASVSFNELVKLYPASADIEKYKLESIESLVRYADKSRTSKKAERYGDALGEITAFMYNYRESKYMEKVEKLKNHTEENLKELNNGK